MHTAKCCSQHLHKSRDKKLHPWLLEHAKLASFVKHLESARSAAHFISCNVEGCLCRGKPARAGRTGDFGHPAHRVTDVLLVINAACFAVQLFTPRLFLLGAKVSGSLIPTTPIHLSLPPCMCVDKSYFEFQQTLNRECFACAPSV